MCTCDGLYKKKARILKISINSSWKNKQLYMNETMKSVLPFVLVVISAALLPGLQAAPFDSGISINYAS